MSITLDDVKRWYETVYRPAGAILVFSGDITPEQGKELAAKLLQGFADRSGEPPKADYALKPAPEAAPHPADRQPRGEAGDRAARPAGVRHPHR